MTPTYQPKALTPEQLTALSQELKQALVGLYGERLDRLVLYGSYARGDFHPESDVDFLVVLRDERVQGGREINRMVPIVGPLTLRYEVELSVFPVSAVQCAANNTVFLELVNAEGTIV